MPPKFSSADKRKTPANALSDPAMGGDEPRFRLPTPRVTFTRGVLASFAAKMPSRGAANPSFSRKYVPRALAEAFRGPNWAKFRRVKLPQRA
jgi:hypothetical protein